VLGTYAEEARQVQARLDALRAQAGDFERSVEGDDDWADDDAKTERVAAHTNLDWGLVAQRFEEDHDLVNYQIESWGL
jgi:hypothetical protein